MGTAKMIWLGQAFHDSSFPGVPRIARVRKGPVKGWQIYQAQHLIAFPSKIRLPAT